MHWFKLVDELRDKYAYEGTDLRAVLTIHHMLHGTEIIKAKRIETEEWRG